MMIDDDGYEWIVDINYQLKMRLRVLAQVATGELTFS